jgi:heterotetrameric sarcosine oxidase delta subunit
MTFQIACPDCGRREVQEFSFGGESTGRPPADAPLPELARYLFFRRNVAGPNVEWWYHRDGCRRWFLAVRDTRTNDVRQTYWPSDRPERSV